MSEVSMLEGQDVGAGQRWPEVQHITDQLVLV